MRITNSMMSSRLLLNMQRNMAAEDTLWNQYSTGKKIQQPSDNPILAARALKFRTAYDETEQYLRNVGQGLSWMQITENSFKNVIESLVGDGYDGGIRALAVSASSSDKTYTDRQAIATNIRSLAEGIKQEMNNTFAGRYVFSGYRTNQPPIYEKNQPLASYEITQNYTFNDIERTYSYYKLDQTTEPEIRSISILKLAYKDAHGLNVVSSSVPAPAAVDAALAGLAKTAATTAQQALNEADPTQKDVLLARLDSELAAVQTRYTTLTGGSTNTAGDDAISTAVNNIRSTITLAPPPSTATYTQTDIDTLRDAMGNVTVMQSNNPLAYQPGVNEVIYVQDTGELVLGSAVEAALKNGDFAITYDKTGFTAGEPNPLAYFTSTDLLTGKQYVMDHVYEYEVGVNTRLPVNSLAKNVLSDKLYADLMGLADLLEKVTLSDRDALRALGKTDEEIEEQITRENQNISNMLHDRFNNMIGMCDKYMSQISREHTDLGSRMKRMELIQNRLSQDRITYEELRSDNEDVDYEELSVKLSNAMAVYQASLAAGARIIQMTLANFI